MTRFSVRRRFAVDTIGFVLSDEVDQAFEADVYEGGDLLIVGPVDPEAAILRFHVDIDLPQQFGILAEHFGGEREGVERLPAVEAVADGLGEVSFAADPAQTGLPGNP
jgi:hypothetical protein